MKRNVITTINHSLDRVKGEDLTPATLAALEERLHCELDWFHADRGRLSCLQLLSEIAASIRSSEVVLSPGYGFPTDSLALFMAGVHYVNALTWDLPLDRFTRSFTPGCTIPIEAGTGGLEAARKVLSGRDEIVEETESGLFKVTFLNGDVFDHAFIKVIHFPALDHFTRTIRHGWRPLDEPTLRLFRRSYTDGSLWFESDRMREWLFEFEPESMSDLCLLNALFHPDRIALYPEVLKGRQHPEGINDGSLRDTYGVAVYQEQVPGPRPDLALKGHTVARTMLSVEAVSELKKSTSLK